jgi:glycosyltransferase involved in cell wall biosynthesis
MITHDHDGLLIEEGNIDAMANALSQLMGDAALRDRLGAQAKSAADRFAPEAIGAIWEDTIRGALTTARGQ